MTDSTEGPGPDSDPGSSQRSNNGTGQPKPQAAAVKPTIKQAVDAFVCEADALADTFPVVITQIASSASQVATEFRGFLHTRGQEQPDGTINIPVDYYSELLNFQRRIQRNRRALQIIPRSLFTALVSHYDAFIGSLLRAIFYMKPEVLSSSEHKFSFKDLAGFTSLDAAREAIVDKEVESLLRESHPEQFKWMEGKFGIPLTKDLPCWPTFVEVTERRNLFVHCNGVVSVQYLTVCKRHGFDCSSTAIGTELQVNSKYFKLAYETILEIGIKLGHVLWRRLNPSEMDAADNNLNNVCLDLIRDEKYSVARTILDFAVTFKTFGSETGRRIFVLNQAQAYKWSGKPKQAEEILAREDWGASSEKFQLGAAVLRDDFKAASKIMRHMGAASSPSKGDYKEWPMFKAFRTTPEFADAFKDVFGEDFGSVPADEIPDKKIEKDARIQ